VTPLCKALPRCRAMCVATDGIPLLCYYALTLMLMLSPYSCPQLVPTHPSSAQHMLVFVVLRTSAVQFTLLK
jgi:hypothetical protein